MNPSTAIGIALFNLNAIGVSAVPMPENSHDQTMGESVAVSLIPNYSYTAMGLLDLSWLATSITCGDVVVLDPLDPLDLECLSDAELPHICLRMHLILDSIEYTAFEGRMINVDVFDPMDRLASDLVHKARNSFGDSAAFISEFGHYYRLCNRESLPVTRHAMDGYRYMFDAFQIRFPLS